MRQTESAPAELGAVPIAAIQIDARSRDDIPAVLLGLQHIHTSESLREKVFARLESQVSPRVRKDTGRPGMDRWRSLCLALDCGYDRLAEISRLWDAQRCLIRTAARLAAAQARFPALAACSFDQGFHSPANQGRARVAGMVQTGPPAASGGAGFFTLRAGLAPADSGFFSKKTSRARQ